MTKFLHRLFNPHCPDCIEEELEKKHCRSCEILASQLTQANFEKKQLLETILNFNKPVEQGIQFTDTTEPIIPKTMPWHIRRQMLETEDRQKAELIRKRNKDLELNKKNEELEKELKLNEVKDNG